MKEKSEQSPILPDGAINFGNGIIGPSASDRNYFNALRYSDQKPPTLRKSTLSSLKLKPNLKGLGFSSIAMTSVLIASACSSGEAQTVTDNSNNELPGFALPFEGTGFLNSGPHNFRLKRDVPTENEIASELDFAPKPVIKCEPGVRAIVTDWNITASESGKITVAGDEKDEADANHSIIQIKHPDGKSTRYTHVANIQVKKDQEVAKRQKLGNPSCEYPPSGSTDGLHLDFSVLGPHGNPIDVRTITLSGWAIEGKLNYQGTMTKDGKTITADGRRCPVENPCDGGKIVNSITHVSNKAVLGAATSPIPQISGNVNEKRVEGVIATPKKESPIPTTIPTPVFKKDFPTPTPTEKPPEQNWIRFTSPNYPYRIDYPNNWIYSNDKFNKMDVFNGPPLLNGYQQMKIYSESVPAYYSFNDYVTEVIDQQRAKSTRPWTQKEYDTTTKIYKDIAYEFGIKINGNKIPVIYNELGNHATIGGDNTYRAFEDIIDYTFIWKGNKWHIIISSPAVVGRPSPQIYQEMEKLIPNRTPILSSFKPIE